MISFLKNLLILRLILLGGGDIVLDLFEKAKNQKPIYVQSKHSNEGDTSAILCIKLNASYQYVYYKVENQSLETHELTFSVIDDNVIYAITFSLSVHNEESIFSMQKRERFSLLKIQN